MPLHLTFYFLFDCVYRVLSGKYLDPDIPVPEARLNKFPGFYARYRTPECNECTARYAKIAAEVSGSALPQICLFESVSQRAFWCWLLVYGVHTHISGGISCFFFAGSSPQDCWKIDAPDAETGCLDILVVEIQPLLCRFSFVLLLLPFLGRENRPR